MTTKSSGPRGPRVSWMAWNRPGGSSGKSTGGSGGGFGNLLENSSCEPHGSDMAIQTRENGVRYPDVTIDCGSPGDDVDDTRLTNPRVVIEILSPSTREYDLLVKSAEYRVITSIDTVSPPSLIVSAPLPRPNK